MHDIDDKLMSYHSLSLLIEEETVLIVIIVDESLDVEVPFEEITGQGSLALITVH